MPKDRDDVQTTAIRREHAFSRPCARVAWQDAHGPRSVVVARPMVVGSASSGDVVIADPTVSRIHAELEPRPDGLWIRDLMSRNGTYVNDVLVGAARVPPRGRIRVGGTTLTLEPDAQQEPVDLWPEGRLGDLVGDSVAMRELYATVVRVAAADAPVLVHGETGSGKELVARAIHDSSHRATKPFVVVDCAALPEALLESELFGHAKGAFTGAAGAHTGTFEEAEGGTVFLDEIGELSLSMQPKLLRVLESRTIRRLGETAHRKVDVRFVAATHRDLRRMVNGGEFREDLFFRLAVLRVRVPPLREHPEDIPRLVEHYAPQMPPDLRAELARALAGQRLTGNVRELRNAVERAHLLGGVCEAGAEGELSPVDPAHAAPSQGLDFDGSFHDFQRTSEREYLRRLLVRCEGQVAEAAQAAGINRTYFYRLLRKHGL